MSDVKPADVLSEVQDLAKLVWLLIYVVVALFVMNLAKFIQQMMSDVQTRKLRTDVRALLDTTAAYAKNTNKSVQSLAATAAKVEQTISSGSDIIKGGGKSDSE